MKILETQITKPLISGALFRPNSLYLPVLNDVLMVNLMEKMLKMAKADKKICHEEKTSLSAWCQCSSH